MVIQGIKRPHFGWRIQRHPGEATRILRPYMSGKSEAAAAIDLGQRDQFLKDAAHYLIAEATPGRGQGKVYSLAASCRNRWPRSTIASLHGSREDAEPLQKVDRRFELGVMADRAARRPAPPRHDRVLLRVVERHSVDILLRFHLFVCLRCARDRFAHAGDVIGMDSLEVLHLPVDDGLRHSVQGLAQILE